MKPDLVIPPGVWFPCKCFQNKMFSEAKNLCFIFYKKLGNDLIFRLFPYKKKKNSSLLSFCVLLEGE